MVTESKAEQAPKFYHFGRGIRDDLARRLPYYWSDYKDGIIGTQF